MADETAPGHDKGILAPTFSQGLREIPDWEQRTRKDNDQARWNQRLCELTTYIAAGNNWPRHKKTDSEEERLLGIWLHIQHMKCHRNDLADYKEEQLNTLLPGWRDGRTRGRRRIYPNIQKDDSRGLSSSAFPGLSLPVQV